MSQGHFLLGSKAELTCLLDLSSLRVGSNGNGAGRSSYAGKRFPQTWKRTEVCRCPGEWSTLEKKSTRCTRRLKPRWQGSQPWKGSFGPGMARKLFDYLTSRDLNKDIIHESLMGWEVMICPCSSGTVYSLPIYRNLEKVRGGPKMSKIKFLILVGQQLSHSILFSKKKVMWYCSHIWVWEVKLILLQLQMIISWLIFMWRSNLKIESNRWYEFLPDCRFLFTGLTGWTNT